MLPYELQENETEKNYNSVEIVILRLYFFSSLFNVRNMRELLLDILFLFLIYFIFGWSRFHVAFSFCLE